MEIEMYNKIEKHIIYIQIYNKFIRKHINMNNFPLRLSC